jgi:hypothetical protein
MIPYIHKTHPRSRSIKIKVEANGQVVVVTPKRTPQHAIEAFVSQNQIWIQRTLTKIELKKPAVSDDQLSIFGKTYQKKVDPTLPVGVHIRDLTCLISPADSLTIDQAKITKQLERFLRNTAEKYIVPRTHRIGQMMGIEFGKITLRQQKTRWGSCSSQGNLNFNWRLVHYTPAIIDYVIIHELAHRAHMDHSSRFWQLVSRYDPDYRQHRGWLKRHGMTVG